MVVLIADGTRDARGFPNGTPAQWTIPADMKFLRLEHGRTPLGKVKNLHWNGAELVADLEVLVEQFLELDLYPAIGAMIENFGQNFTLHEISLATSNSDTRIKPIKDYEKKES